MSERRDEQVQKWNFTKKGSFGHFSTDNSVPVQFVMTTFSMDELSKLSYAREVQTSLNFDLLIQRDIDEDRAIAEISQYISPTKTEKKSDEIVFLPPLLVAVIGTKQGRQIEEYYPDEDYEISKDKIGQVFTREWDGLFQITHYDMDKGYELTLTSSKENKQDIKVKINPSECKIEFGLGNEDDPGARLVVIDGQHRLFALKYLKKHLPEKVKNILLPVCILFSPKSTVANKESNTPPVPKVLRDLFVDVNSTVEKVSGHFVILLSDQTLGSMICRIFCDDIYQDGMYGPKGLSLIEWNTKNHKQSKTISKAYTITSIGVIYDVLDEFFSKKPGNTLLKYMINVDSVIDELDFGQGDDDEPLTAPDDFPWRNFRYQNKSYLEKLVRANFTPSLKRLFFELEAYKVHFGAYVELIQKLEKMASERTSASTVARNVLDHLLVFNPIDKKAEALLTELVADMESDLDNKRPQIVRMSIFQKGMLEAWLAFVEKAKRFNIRLEDATTIFILLVNHALSRKTGAFINDAGHSYLQDSVYDGVAIIAKKESKLQIKRLILAFLGNKKLLDQLVEKIKQNDPGVDTEKFQADMREFGFGQAADFNMSLYRSRRRTFESNYPSMLSLDSEIREQLAEAQHKKTNAIRDKSQEIPDDFDKLVNEQIKPDLENSCNQLNSVLSYKSSNINYGGLQEEDI